MTRYVRLVRYLLAIWAGARKFLLRSGAGTRRGASREGEVVSYREPSTGGWARRA